jgi:hypothetical protein
MGSYEGLFKVPIVEAPSFDGTRDTSITFQNEVDGIIDDLLELFGVRHHRLDPGNREGWVDVVMSAMELPLQPPQLDIFL